MFWDKIYIFFIEKVRKTGKNIYWYNHFHVTEINILYIELTIMKFYHNDNYPVMCISWYIYYSHMKNNCQIHVSVVFLTLFSVKNVKYRYINKIFLIYWMWCLNQIYLFFQVLTVALLILFLSRCEGNFTDNTHFVFFIA